ncbi:hypothetical protein C8R44DRAFT_880514 [Mycena epipterygia]|nr:hypothetical protein C8R44DRAFT_880514 [Mycena epipterygia]
MFPPTPRLSIYVCALDIIDIAWATNLNRMEVHQVLTVYGLGFNGFGPGFQVINRGKSRILVYPYALDSGVLCVEDTSETPASSASKSTISNSGWPQTQG